MQKNFKNDLDLKYNDIFKNLYTQWKLQSKEKYEELASEGLSNSGIGSNAMYELIEKLINEVIYDLQQLFNNLLSKYNRKMSAEELDEYKEKTINNIEGHINDMEKELKNKYNNNSLFVTESNEVFLNNLKGNSKNKIEKLFDEINNLEKGKKVEVNVVVAILSLFIGIASLIIASIALNH